MAKGNRKKATSKGKHAKDMGKLSDDFQSSIYDLTSASSVSNLEPEAQRLENERAESFDPFSHIQIMKKLIATTGTDVDEMNVTDPFGDGDQKPLLRDTHAQVYRNLWSDGFDLSICFQFQLFHPFTMSCVLGDLPSVKAQLNRADSPKDRRELLERRQTVFRGSPIMLTTGLAKYPEMVQANAQRMNITMDHEGVVRLLLKSGANPRAKDTAGKTLVHWGSGGISTPISRTFADWCIDAAKSSAYFGQNITLDGLSNASYNGLEGILGGYDVDTERRVVTVQVDSKEKEILIKPQNIFHDGKCIYEDDYNLVDIPDRLGSVALHELIMRGDPEAAKLLCDKHNANVDVKELSGVTPRYMALRPMMGLESEAMSIVKRHACKTGINANSCNSCQKKSKDLFKCARCGDVWYCNRDCQKVDWSNHKKVCRSKEGITLQKFVRQNGEKIFSSNRKGVFVGGYTRPPKVKENELFWVKVQRAMGDNSNSPLLLYDKSRKCQFEVMPGTPGFMELSKEILAEKSSMGTKTHFQAKFNEKDEMIIFPHSAKLLSW